MYESVVKITDKFSVEVSESAGIKPEGIIVLLNCHDSSDERVHVYTP